MKKPKERYREGTTPGGRDYVFERTGKTKRTTVIEPKTGTSYDKISGPKSNKMHDLAGYDYGNKNPGAGKFKATRSIQQSDKIGKRISKGPVKKAK